MKKMIFLCLITITLFFTQVGQSQALTMLGIDPPASLLVVRGGMEWAYAGPCAPVVPSCGVVSLHHGFAIPTVTQWTASFSSLSDFLTAFNIPGGPVPNAAPYFNTGYDHIDIGDAAAGYIWGSPFAPDLYHSSDPVAEAFLVRGGHPVPEPASLLLVGFGLAGVAYFRRKKAA
ncbi:MAG: PEP-CTERM sorting domain-containing protein [Nitrospirae bacterium]|nr:PEP-CTERM sorting domain-containing protein [Nitrospirota bacterium]